MEAIERGTEARTTERAQARADTRSAALLAARARSDRWRWRAALAVGVAGLVYFGFLVGLMLGMRGELVQRPTTGPEAR